MSDMIISIQTKNLHDTFVFVDTLKVNFLTCMCTWIIPSMPCHMRYYESIMHVLLINIQNPYEQVRCSASDCLQKVLSTINSNGSRDTLTTFLYSKHSINSKKAILDSIIIMLCNIIAEYKELDIGDFLFEVCIPWIFETWGELQDNLIIESDVDNSTISWMELTNRMNEFIEILSYIHITSLSILQRMFLLFQRMIPLSNEAKSILIPWQQQVKLLNMFRIFYTTNLFNLSTNTTTKDRSMYSPLEKDILAWSMNGLSYQVAISNIELLEEGFCPLIASIIRTCPRLVPVWISLIKNLPDDSHYVITLAYSSLIHAFPYDIPTWMPEIVVKFSSIHSKREKIQAIIRRTMAEFRRTHRDTWMQEKSKFTPDQLDIIMETITAPSYFG